MSHAVVTLVPDDGPAQLLQRRRVGARHQHEPAAVQQRAPDLQRGRVERDGRRLQHHLVRRQAGRSGRRGPGARRRGAPWPRPWACPCCRTCRSRTPGCAAPHRSAGSLRGLRARCASAVRVHARRRGAPSARKRRRAATPASPAPRAPESASMNARRSARIRRVQRHVRAAGLERRQHGDDASPARAPGTSPTRTSGPTPSAGRWCASRLARASSSAVGERSVAVHQRDGVRRARRLRLRTARGCTRSAGRRRPCGSTPPAPARRSGVVQQLQRGQAARPRPPPPAPARAPGAPAIRSMVRALEQVRAYSSPPRSPSAPLARPSVRSNLAVPAPPPTARGDGQPGEAGRRRRPPRRPSVQGEHHLEERRVAQAALRLQLRHQLLERHVLVLVRAQRHVRARGAAPRGRPGRRPGPSAAPAC